MKISREVNAKLARIEANTFLALQAIRLIDKSGGRELASVKRSIERINDIIAQMVNEE